MLGEAKRIYLATRKKHDQLFNTYFMRPIAGLVVAILARTPITPNQVTILNLVIFVIACALLIALPAHTGGLIAIGVLELSYLLDCTDGMLARHKGLASKEGHLFDFFTDEIKAVLLAGVAGVIILASAVSLTNFVRRPELSGRETSVAAYYETVERERHRSLTGRAAELLVMFLRFLNHYPSHIWIFALTGRLELFFWIYVSINLLYLAKGWLGLILRFGRAS